MIFEEGKSYINTKTGRSVTLIQMSTEDHTLILDVVELDPLTSLKLFHNVIRVQKRDINDWELLELIS